eukprot:752276-Hanusia_phi.AAC.6
MRHSETSTRTLYAGILLLALVLLSINHVRPRASSLLDVDAPDRHDVKKSWQPWYNAGAGFDPAAKPVTTAQLIRSNYPREPYYDQGAHNLLRSAPCKVMIANLMGLDAERLYKVHPEYFTTAKPLRGLTRAILQMRPVTDLVADYRQIRH